MKKHIKLFGVMAIIAVIVFLFGCATTSIWVTYTEPARFNMNGVNRVAIDSDNDSTASYLSQRLTSTGKYTVATASELQGWKQWLTAQGELGQRAAYQNGAIEISPANLVKAYTDNAARADDNYEGQTLKIRGTVEEIQRSSSGTYLARFGVGNNAVDVFFHSSERQKIAALNKGQQVTVFGECYGFKRPDTEDTAEILRLLGAGQRVNIVGATFLQDINLPEYSGNIDAVITLKTTSSTQNTSNVERRYRRGSDGKSVQYDVTVYERTVTVTINFNIVRARDSSSIGNGAKTATSQKSSNEDRSQLATVSDLFTRTINGPLAQLADDIVPTPRSMSVALAKSDNKEIKNAMNDAQNLVKANDYAGAVQA